VVACSLSLIEGPGEDVSADMAPGTLGVCLLLLGSFYLMHGGDYYILRIL
jgi:hypothetical protein